VAFGTRAVEATRQECIGLLKDAGCFTSARELQEELRRRAAPKPD
jgi:hypothetical protein